MRKSLHLWQHPSLLRIIISKCGWCNERFFFPEWLRSWSTVYIMLLTLMVNGKIKSSSYLNMKFWKRWMVSSSKTISIRHERLDHKSVRVITESSTGTWIVWLTKNEKTGRSVSSTIQQISVTPSQAKEIQTMSDKQEIYDCMCMSYGDQTSPFAHRVPPPPPCEQSTWHVFMISRITCILNNVFFPVTDIYRANLHWDIKHITP